MRRFLFLRSNSKKSLNDFLDRLHTRDYDFGCVAGFSFYTKVNQVLNCSLPNDPKIS